jgi:hypothetical protein
MPEQPATGASAGGATWKLRIEPDKCREAQKIYLAAVAELVPVITAGYRQLRVTPWLGDPVSEKTAERFNGLLVDNEGSCLKRIVEFRDRLQGVADACGKVADEYERTEEINAQNLGRRA